MNEKKVMLELVDMTKKYGNGDGVEHIGLKVYEGEIVTLLGPSGCGKSTILRTIGGFLDVTSGDIQINGRSIVNLPPEKRPTAMVFQSYNLWPHMTIYENLAYGLKLRKRPASEIKENITKILAMISMPGCEKKYPSQLSGGQQQRIAIARMFLKNPPIIFLDEPTASLDAIATEQIKASIDAIKQNRTVIIIPHSISQIIDSDIVYALRNGRVEQSGDPDSLYKKGGVYKEIVDASARSLNIEKLAHTLDDNNDGVLFD